ncbi:MAG: glutamine amidotransferase [Candidatus Nomurabacteria bacterium]|jgi:CobQ-like glutamine amidotransferase family enzyme|nr:glutamine amidotransferase [Candidatus Nomurabacteria bacterium]
MTKSLKILVLYPEEMNIYGDHGNLLTLQKRAEKRGLTTETVLYEPDMKFDERADIILGGGGQDSGQSKIQDDLAEIAPKLRKLAASGTPMLVICGLYQLFGRYFETATGEKINGIGIFDAYTVAGPKRLIGNIVTKSAEFGELVGYENHSGLTFLGQNQKPLARVKKGAGNDASGKFEGARTGNVFGSYLHGPILPKNPRLADEIIRLAAVKKYPDFKLSQIDDSLAEKARAIAKKRPR